VVLAAVTLASRVVGFARSLVFSKTVGDTCLGDVYNAANTLPNTLFEIVAGGVLAGVVIPVVARQVSAGSRADTARTVSALLTWTLLVLTVAGVAALVGATAYARAFTQPACADGVEVLAALLVMFVPQIWLYGLAVVSAGVLQAHHRFLAAALAPLLSSVVVIAAYLGYALLASGSNDDLPSLSRQALLVLGLGTTAGVLVLAATNVVAMARLRLRLRPRLTFAAGDARVITSIAAASLAGLILQQVSILEISWVAQRAGEPGALTRYVWAAAIYLLPYAVLAAPLLQIVFPRLTAAAAAEPGEVVRVLRETTPVLTLAGCLGGAVLVATAVPVARVFVLGPGSGDTGALAWPIVAFAPAVIAFTLLGLASRTLLARHLARHAGLTVAVAWGAVIVGVAVAWLALPSSWLVTGIAAATSLGLGLGAGLGWYLVGRGLPEPGWLKASLVRPLGVGLLAALLAGTVPGAAGLLAYDSALGIALGVAAAVGLGCLAVFVGAVALVDREQLRRLRQLRQPAR
jgi:putative peptidoglycan lipid II flippase